MNIARTVWLAFLILAVASPLAVGDAPSVRDLTQYLENRFSLDATRIAEYLTFYGRSSDPTQEPVLVRWFAGPLSVSILTSETDPRVVSALEQSMSDTAALAGQKVNYCSEEIATSGATGLPSLIHPINDLRCVRQKHDVLIFVDSSRTAPTNILRAFEGQAQDATAISFWHKVDGEPATYYQNTTCTADFTIDPDRNLIASGVALFRLVLQGKDNLQWVDTCVNVLPFLIYAQRPLPRSPTQSEYAAEMLELNYSSKFQPGMPMSDILKALSER